MLEIATTKQRSSGENIFLMIDRVLKEINVPWEKVVCFSADNAAVMMGSQIGIAAFIEKANPNVYTLGCLCESLGSILLEV